METEGYDPAVSLGVQLLHLLGLDPSQVKELDLMVHTTLTREDIDLRLALDVPRVGGLIYRQLQTYKIMPKGEKQDG